MGIDWNDPTVQGAAIAGLISLGGVALAAVAGVAGAIAGARIGAGAMRAEGERQRQAETARRLREWDLLRIDHTRSQLVAIADGFLAIMDKDLRKARAHLASADTMLLANARLVGDVDALSSMARAVVGTIAALPSNALVRLFRIVATNPFDDGQRDAMRTARAEILTALERQQARAIRDEPLVELTAEQVSSIPELRRADEGLAAVQRDLPSAEPSGSASAPEAG